MKGELWIEVNQARNLKGQSVITLFKDIEHMCIFRHIGDMQCIEMGINLIVDADEPTETNICIDAFVTVIDDKRNDREHVYVPARCVVSDGCIRRCIK